MPVNPKYLAPFEPGRCYHIYNRTNNKELLFRSNENRRYFLKRYKELVGPFVKTYAYTLMGNHFHFVIETRSIEELIFHLNRRPHRELNKTQKDFINDNSCFHSLLSKQMSNWFASYSQATSKRWKRNGNLFQRQFRRVQINRETHLSHLIFYIHKNCEKHGVSFNFADYHWSSYSDIVRSDGDLVDFKFVRSWYGGYHNFIKFHNESELSAEVEMPMW